MELLLMLGAGFVTGVIVGRLWADHKRSTHSAYVSRLGTDGRCTLHHQPPSAQDGICPECRAEDARTGGEYLRAFGRPRQVALTK